MDMHEMEAIRRLLGEKPRPVGWAERRRRIEEVGSAWPPAADITFQAVDLDGVPGEFSLAPGSDDSRVLLYFHGGGYCSGSILSHRRLVTEAGRAGGLRTLAVQYRLAPEHPYPAALDDAWTAWRFLRRQGLDAGRIALGGDSAGGNLAVALMTRLRDAGEALPACAWLLSPWTDLTQSGETLTTRDALDPLIHRAYLDELAAAFVPIGMAAKDPRISVLWSDLAGLPPLLIQVGSAETLMDDSIRFTRAAGCSEVPVSLEIWPHMIHAWPMWNARLEQGRLALAGAGAFLRRHLTA